MSCRSFFAAAASVMLLSCSSGGGDEAGGSLSSLFDALNGEYQLEEGTDCAIEILGSRVRSLDSRGRTLCQRGDGWFESMEMSGKFSDTRMSGTLDYTHEGDEDFEYDAQGSSCLVHYTETVSITAALDKLRGRTREGRFAGLAGVWEGTLTIEERDTSGSQCPSDTPHDDVQTETYHIEADITGDAMLISYELVSGKITGEFPETYVPGGDNVYYYPLIGASGQLEIEAVSGGDILVDGELVEVR